MSSDVKGCFSQLNIARREYKERQKKNEKIRYFRNGLYILNYEILLFKCGDKTSKFISRSTLWDWFDG